MKAVDEDGELVELEDDGIWPDHLVPLDKPFNIRVCNRAERVYVNFMASDYGFQSSDYICDKEDFPFVIKLLPQKRIEINDKPEDDYVFNFDDAYQKVGPYCREQEDAEYQIGRHKVRLHNNRVEMLYKEHDKFAIKILKECYKFLDKVWCSNEVSLKAKHDSNEVYHFNQHELEKILERYQSLW